MIVKISKFNKEYSIKNIVSKNSTSKYLLLMNDLVIPLNSLKNDKTLNIKNLSINTILLKK